MDLSAVMPAASRLAGVHSSFWGNEESQRHAYDKGALLWIVGPSRVLTNTSYHITSHHITFPATHHITLFPPWHPVKKHPAHARDRLGGCRS